MQSYIAHKKGYSERNLKAVRWEAYASMEWSLMSPGVLLLPKVCITFHCLPLSLLLPLLLSSPLYSFPAPSLSVSIASSFLLSPPPLPLLFSYVMLPLFLSLPLPFSIPLVLLSLTPFSLSSILPLCFLFPPPPSNIFLTSFLLFWFCVPGPGTGYEVLKLKTLQARATDKLSILK